ncbi:uncharacterized protein LOC133501488 isoform X2 [Syngnathoides biaculeatus]|uniref:uncharacterized protein LOC133501488 isoform X2 n=1 Tax=Syngnathoides biaculeatus TaxID=300417 RepID=UPI002ADD3E9E|nr:uncharacterized protein LOC133501488 isoform X2 [Syngnathoides biaculeatus]
MPSRVPVQEEEEMAVSPPPSRVPVQEEEAIPPPPSRVPVQEEVAMSPPPSCVPVQEYQQRPVRGRPTPLSQQRQELGSSVEPPRSWRDFGMAVMVAVMALVLLSIILFAPEGSQPLQDLASLEQLPASAWFLLQHLVPHRGRLPKSPRVDPGAWRPGRPPDLSTRTPCVWWPGWGLGDYRLLPARSLTCSLRPMSQLPLLHLTACPIPNHEIINVSPRTTLHRLSPAFGSYPRSDGT